MRLIANSFIKQKIVGDFAKILLIDSFLTIC